MRWRGRRGSVNIEGRRRARGGRVTAGGAGGLGLLAIVLIGWFFGVDLTPLLTGNGGSLVSPRGQGTEITAADEERAQFVSVVLADTEAVWSEIFPAQVGNPYDPPTLVLFKGVVRSACGGASAATGPFYCPADEKAYLDTAFFTTLSRRLGAGGDFAAAYVVAHEVAHHVQNELGILGQASRIRAQVDERESNAISVRVELQADCLSGIWARYAEDRLGTLEPGDIAEAMNAAAQIGDDTLQRRAGQAVRPHTFSHGTSRQRQSWFRRGYETPRIEVCDTFSAARL